jgi:hypothetical protein
LPRTVRVSKVHVQAQLLAQQLVARHLASLIVGHGLAQRLHGHQDCERHREPCRFPPERMPIVAEQGHAIRDRQQETLAAAYPVFDRAAGGTSLRSEP